MKKRRKPTQDGEPQTMTKAVTHMRLEAANARKLNALDALAEYQEQQAEGTLEDGTPEPQWREWNVPTLREECIQANGNVVTLEDATDSIFDYTSNGSRTLGWS